MKEFLKETQPIFYRILEKSFKENKKTHAFLLVGDRTDDIATFIAQSYICHEDTLACETCDDCIRIKEGLYPDMIVCDGKETSIKKSDIDHIQEEFVKSSVENNGKVYILKNIDNATTQAMNSLLKFLEEPVEEVYAILTTKNINKVLPTIQSRCQVIKLLSESKHSLELKLKNEGWMKKMLGFFLICLIRLKNVMSIRIVSCILILRIMYSTLLKIYIRDHRIYRSIYDQSR